MSKVRIATAGAVIVALAAGIGVYLGTRSSPSRGHQPPGPVAGGAPSTTVSPSKSPPLGALVVTAYGADPAGQHDSTVAIRNAIAAAEAKAGSTVFFPAGTYTLDDNDGAKMEFLIRGPNPIVVLGAGRDTTTIVEKVGLVTYPGLAKTKAVFQIATPGGDGTTISGLTVDSQTYSGGTTVLDYANNTTIDHGRFLGARSDKKFNRDVFDVRIIAVCNHTNNVHRSNNKVDDLILVGRGSAGNVDLDISCQWDDRVSNITDNGNGMALYIDRRVTVDGYNYTPGTVQNTPRSYIVTGPSDHLSLNNIVTSGNGGDFQSSPKNYRITDVTINRENMTKPGSELIINDADNIAITNSVIAAMVISPVHGTHGLAITSSTVGHVRCQPKSGATISSLTGISCG